MSDQMLFDSEWVQELLLRAQKVDSRYPYAVWSASVVHWFDVELLQFLLQEFPILAENRNETGSDKPFIWLIARPFVERYHQPSFTDTPPRYNLIERVRSVLLSDLNNDPDRFRALSERAKEYHRKKIELDNSGQLERELHRFEMLYHWLAIDQKQAFEQLTDLYQELESNHKFAECDQLLTLAEEQERIGVLTGHRSLWLEYYRGRLQQRLQRSDDALCTLEKLLPKKLPPGLGSLVEDELRVISSYSSALGFWDSAESYFSEDHFIDAIESYRRALHFFRDLSDRRGESEVLERIGDVYHLQGQWQDALEQYQAVLIIYRELSDLEGSAGIFAKIGMTCKRQGKLDRALEYYREALEVFHRLGDLWGKANTLNNMGSAYLSQNQCEAALENYQLALKIARELENREYEFTILLNVGETYDKQGHREQAQLLLQQAIQIARELENKDLGVIAQERLDELVKDRK